MDIPSIINHNYYVVRDLRNNRTWICEAERFDKEENRLYYYYSTYELGSDEHKNNCYLDNSYYDIHPAGNDEIRLATMEEIDILMDVLEKNNIVISLQEAKDKAKAPDLKGEDYSNKRFGYKIPDGYEFDEVVDGKIFLTPIKPKYPKTYVECCDELDDHDKYGEITAAIARCSYKGELITSFTKLLICRDAYWKIVGMQMGLGKPWKPDLMDETTKYGIMTYQNAIIKDNVIRSNRILVFPTHEIRNTFHKNFKDLIEQCKELL